MTLTHTEVCLNAKTILISVDYITVWRFSPDEQGGFWIRLLKVVALCLGVALSTPDFVDEGLDFLAQAVAFVG